MALEQTVQTISSPQTSAAPQGFDYDLAIVGGGIIGATLACALKDSGLRVALIERSPQSAAVAIGRAYAISLMSGRIFEGMGVWDKILPQINAFQQIRLSDADYPGIVQFSPQDLGTERLGYGAEHRVLLTALQDSLRDCPNVSWLCPAEVVSADYQADAVEIEIAVRGEIPHSKIQSSQASEIPPNPPSNSGGDQGKQTSKIRTRLLVAADGARSPIREAAGIRTQGWHYWQSCVVATIKPEKPHQNIAYERFWPSGPMGVLPLPGNRCQVVWTAPHTEAKALKEIDEKEFLAELERRTAGLLGRLELEGDRYVFPVQLMQSDRYTLPRLALIGDAAHCCHPVAGQGMNLGIRDAAAIAQVLKSAHNLGEDIGDIQVLKRYERWRKQENLTILGFTDFLDRMFSNNWLPVVAIRRLGLWMLRRIRPVKTFALQLMTGLRGRHPELASR
ncbi:FAD-dependent hydroxylase [Coleofasciculus sp. FACHB-64]|uniref:FAD-dependent hydroxylase n=1 Tax=Cyanophyceae TaxID=3028117 RepID=UPI0016831FAB|nr:MULTISPECIES: FAD-dependent hydroxylase [unclassified Coleofasciculus]MBD1841087.1 FAD-dependent hydroxylase [Coleofasciculus sp. FACHB-501]MBD2046657.1 FAD-dependent hydroxylase [Coleofasciculus sp. FACHB-64]